jgi:hypothetical protein
MPADLDGPRANELRPLDHAEVPPGELEGILDRDDHVVSEPGVCLAELPLPSLDEQPLAPALAVPVVIEELEADDDAPVG